jgi:ABC-type Fe3+-hydroxamate transport system substrate-binding protein
MTPMKILSAAAVALAVAIASAPSPVWAQNVAVKGTVTGTKGDLVIIKDSQGNEIMVALKPDAVVMTVGTATLGDIKTGSYVGVGARPQADGSQKAIRVMIFPEMQRGTGEGHYPWTTPGSVPNSTMTNATVDTTVAGVDGQVLTVKYKDGDKKIIIGPDAVILSNIPGTASDLKPGAAIAVPAATKKADGTLETARVNIGRGSFVP